MKTNLRIAGVRKIIAFFLAVCLCMGVVLEGSMIVAVAEDNTPIYKIMVNRAANCVTVYAKDNNGEFSVPVKAFVCSCGREGHETPLGTFKTSNY